MRPLGLRPRVVVCQLEPYLTRILSLAVQALPDIALPTTRHNDICQANPRLTHKIRALVLAEDTDLEVVVVRAVVDGESELLVPFGSLSASLVRLRLLRFLAEACSTVGTLLAHRLAVGKVLRSVDNDDQRAYLWTIDGHVGEDAGGVLLAIGTAHSVGELGGHAV